MRAIGLMALAAALAAPALAEDASQKNQSYIEEHKKLSELHGKAAECLSSKSVEECRAEIAKDCPAELGDCSSLFDSTPSGMRDAVRGGSESGVESKPASESGEPLPSDSGAPETGAPDDVNR